MRIRGIAVKSGSTSASITKLIETGQGSAGLAVRIGSTSNRITQFVEGEATPGIARALGTTTANAQIFRDLIGREGAIGLIIGLACGMDRD